MITKVMNSKGNIKQYSAADYPINPRQPVIARMAPVESTLNQTVINLPWYVDTVNAQDSFFLAIDGRILSIGSSYDYAMTSVDVLGFSNQVTLTAPLVAGLNIQAWKLGNKKESEFAQDQRFVNIYDNLDKSFQGFVDQSSLMTATATVGSPSAGTFHSTVTGRSSMVDLRLDLKPRMGIERIQMQSIYQIANEYGPNGEIVWGVAGDLLNQIRLIGDWSVNIGIDGNRVFAGTNTTDYIEVTFYGTGFNLLGTRHDARNVAYSVDGGSETTVSNFWGTSAIITNRNFASNAIANTHSGLSLGVHTVKVRSNSSAALQLSGCEIVNESSSVKTNPGNGYVQGKKLATSLQDSTSYSSGVTGTRGGRMLVYQNSDGSIARSFQAVDAASATLASTSHTNEEVVRVHHVREFGASRTDDFSRLSTSSNVYFTLDDNTTNLVSNQAAVGFSAEGVEGASLSNNNATTGVFTFVGTGLDVEIFDSANGGSDSYTFQIDGGTAVAWPYTSGSTKRRIQKIVSGLPYGTHTFKINRVTAATWNVNFIKFFVYQPKKPTLPSGAVELAEYNVMANFTANATAGLDTVSTGILRKTCIREFLYTNGTGGTSDWAIDSTANSHIAGLQLFSDRLNAFAQLTAFGTGFDLRYSGGANRSTNVTLTANGLTVNTTNFPGLTVSNYGGGSYNTSTGQYSQSTSSTLGAGLVISGLPLGLYTFRFTNNTAGSFLIIETMDVITPIHSAKSQLYYDVQNTLMVGSQGISDNRKLSPVKEPISYTKNVAQAVGFTSNPTTTSTTNVPLPDMSVVISTKTGKLNISYTAQFSNNTAQNFVGVTIYINGQSTGIQRFMDAPAANYRFPVSDNYSIFVGPGTYKVDLYWATQSGSTATAAGTIRSLTVKEE